MFVYLLSLQQPAYQETSINQDTGLGKGFEASQAAQRVCLLPPVPTS